MNTSVLWIAPPTTPKIDTWLTRVRSGGLLPVRVDTADTAQQVLRQFRAGVVVIQAAVEQGATDCERLVQAGSPVVAVIEDTRYAQIFLSVGCAAVIGDTCPAGTFVDILQQVAEGKRSLTWPDVAGSAGVEKAV